MSIFYFYKLSYPNKDYTENYSNTRAIDYKCMAGANTLYFQYSLFQIVFVWVFDKIKNAHLCKATFGNFLCMLFVYKIKPS